MRTNGTGAESKTHGRTYYIEDLNDHPVFYYGVSFNISPYYKVNGKQWNKYDKDEQKKTIEAIYCNVVTSVTGKAPDTYIFELTEKKNWHIHDLLLCKEYELKMIQDEINKHYKYAKDPIDRVFDFSRTLVHKSFWQKYMEKDQEDFQKETTSHSPYSNLDNSMFT